MNRPSSHFILKNGLFVRSWLPNLCLLFLSKILRRKRKLNQVPKNLKKILLCNIANLGDVVISTCVLPVIQKKFPNCEIGFLTSSTSAVVLKGHPLVTRIHEFNHWYLHRHLGYCKAVLHHWKSRRRFLQELKKIKYDVAIDLYSYYPNAIAAIAKSQIPICIGYTTGGFSSLLTHPVEWKFHDRYVGYAHLHLLSLLEIDVSKESPLPSYHYQKTKREYIVIHMGSLHSLKEWDLNKWVELILRLEADGQKIILTGRGTREGSLCQYVAIRTQAQDWSNQLSWLEFVVLIQEARLLISVDSVAVHIAAGAETPTVGLFTGMNLASMWMPPFPFYVGLMKQVPCSPCLNKRGCSSMFCIKDIGVEKVYQNALRLIKSTLSMLAT